jgi:hypothetical protein
MRQRNLYILVLEKMLIQISISGRSQNACKFEIHNWSDKIAYAHTVGNAVDGSWIQIWTGC